MRKAKPPTLRPHEEKEILDFIMEKSKRKEEVLRKDITDKVVTFLKSDSRKNPFRNGLPGDKWFSLFRRRHNGKFLELGPRQLAAIERIGFSEKVVNTINYSKSHIIVKKEYAREYTPRRRKIPKVEIETSTPIESSPSLQDRSQNTSETVFTSPSEESCNTNVDDSEKSQESISDSAHFQPGSKLEVMDFNDDKWYSVKVVEVDYEEGEVLVHFEKWSNRYDEWVRMDSNRIRRPQLPSSCPKKVFKENEKVIAVWAYNHKYPATVRKVLPNDKYEILFCDGYAKILRGCKLFKATEEDLKNIQLPPPKKPAPPMGADPLDPDLGPKEERRLKKRRMDVYEALRPQKKQRSNHPSEVLSQSVPEHSSDFSTQSSPLSTTQPSSSSLSTSTQPPSSVSTSTQPPSSVSAQPSSSLSAQSSSLSTQPSSLFKPKEMPKVVFKGRGRPRRIDIEKPKIKSEDSQEDDDDDDGWIEEDNEDSDQAVSPELIQKRKRRTKKKLSDDPFSIRHYKPGLQEESERWNTEIPEGVLPVQIKDTEGYYRESIIIPDKKLPPGWTKHTMRRKTGAKWDVFLVNEEGRKFRSRNELRSYFGELKQEFPEDSFDFMVGRKMEMIRSQVDLRKKIGSESPVIRKSPVHKKTEGKGSDSKSNSDQRRIKTLLPKGRTTDSGDEVKQDQSSKLIPEPATPAPPFPIAELRTPDGGYTCCGKSFRKENLFQMHMKHYHPEYSNLFGSTPNVADLAYARTVGEPLEDSRAEAMTPSNTLMERVTKYEAERKALSDAAALVKEEPPDEFSGLKIKQEIESVPTPKPVIEEASSQPPSDVEKKDNQAAHSKEKKEENKEQEETKEDKKPVLEKVAVIKPAPVNEVLSPAPVEEKKSEADKKVDEPSTSTPVVEEPPLEKCPQPSKPIPKPTPPQPPPNPSPVPHSIPVIKPVSKVSSEAVIVQTTSSPKAPVTITKYVPPGQSKPPSSDKVKVTISADKEGKPTIKTLLPMRPPAPEPKDIPEPPKPKEVKTKEEVEEVSNSQIQKARPRKRTVSESLPKKPKLAKAATGSLEEESKEATEVTASTSSAGSTAASGTGSGYRFSRNRSQVPRVSLEKLSVTPDSNGRVVLGSPEDKTPITEGRRPFKKFKSTNNIIKRHKGTSAEAKSETVEDMSAASDVIYENLRKEEIINCTCGFTEEDGLMIQCDLCLCWQHGYCNNINKEEEVPEKYVCYICQNPARQRASSKYIHNQDWLKEGKLPSLSFRPKNEESVTQREKTLKKSHDLSASVQQLENVIYSLRVKTHIATMKQDHPKLYLWAKSWKDENTEAKNESEEEKNKKEILGPQPEAAIDTKECRLRLLEHIEDYQNQVEDRLTSIDAQIAALEAEDPDLTSEDVAHSRMKQTLQMLLRDLTTIQRVAALT